MQKMKSKNNLAGLGLLTAISASLCCITPVLALLAGTSGMASTFSWLQPFRPYLIGFTVCVLGFAWYQQLKPKKQIVCNCDNKDLPTRKAVKTPFIHSKIFLGIITAFAVGILAFPYYSGIFYSKSNKPIIVVDKSNVKKAEFTITGMTCTSCEEHINHAVTKLPGIIYSYTSYKKGNAIVEFDISQTSVSQIEKAINATGYTVTAIKEF